MILQRTFECSQYWLINASVMRNGKWYRIPDSPFAFCDMHGQIISFEIDITWEKKIKIQTDKGSLVGVLIPDMILISSSVSDNIRNSSFYEKLERAIRAHAKNATGARIDFLNSNWIVTLSNNYDSPTIEIPAKQIDYYGDLIASVELDTYAMHCPVYVGNRCPLQNESGMCESCGKPADEWLSEE